MTFTPTDAADYNPVTKTTTINVLQAPQKRTPIITWANPPASSMARPWAPPSSTRPCSVQGTFGYFARGRHGPGRRQESNVLGYLHADRYDRLQHRLATQCTINVDAGHAYQSPGPTPPTSSTAPLSRPPNSMRHRPGSWPESTELSRELSPTHRPRARSSRAARARPSRSPSRPPTAPITPTATKTAMINVTQATPTIAWANPADITFGTLPRRGATRRDGLRPGRLNLDSRGGNLLEHRRQPNARGDLHADRYEGLQPRRPPMPTSTSTLRRW